MMFKKKLTLAEIKKNYAEELRRKDAEIEKLKTMLDAARKSALKQNREKLEFQDYAKRLVDINKRLNVEVKKKRKHL